MHWHFKNRQNSHRNAYLLQQVLNIVVNSLKQMCIPHTTHGFCWYPEVMNTLMQMSHQKHGSWLSKRPMALLGLTESNNMLQRDVHS